MKIASKWTLHDIDIAAELRVHGATWETIAQVQIGTMGTTLLRASRARRKVHIRKVIHHVPEVLWAESDDKLSPFVTIPSTGGPVLKSLLPGLGRRWDCSPRSR